MRTRGRYARAIAAPAAAVEQPVAADEGAARRASSEGVLRLRLRRQGPQNQARREGRANRGGEVAVWRVAELKRRIRLVDARVRAVPGPSGKRFEVRKSAGLVRPGMCTTRFWYSASRLSQRA